jgi:uncharacterized repeat protein (TIGR01451 family)
MKFFKHLITKIDRWLRPPSSAGESLRPSTIGRTGIFRKRKVVKIGGAFDRHQQSKSREIRHNWKWIQRFLAGTAALIFALSPSAAYANIAMGTNPTAATILSTLTGVNVTLSNLVIKQGTAANSIATFSGGLTGAPNIGIDTGVALVTGVATTAPGPNNTGSKSTGSAIQVTDDPEIVQVTGSSIGHPENAEFDVTSISFDVVPQGNILGIKFVFGSEEYNEYVCSIYNDAMGIFVKINGTYTNIAKVGSSDLSINQINIGAAGNAFVVPAQSAPCNLTNSAYFINNPANSANLQYDGFTKPIEAQYAVTPGTTYSLKIVIADIGDAALDSAVFVNKISSYLLDYGDAPDTYVTAPIIGGIALTEPARHATGPNLYLGALAPDAENTVTPATGGNIANSDDISGIDDEDAFSNSDLFILAGATSYSIPSIPVHNGLASTAKLMGWIDFNKNGTFDATELASTTVATGINTAALSWAGITTPAAGTTSYARFRITTDPAFFTTASPIGLAIDGEVEDYRVKFDTRANIGAKVMMVKRITAIKPAGSTTWVRTKNPNEPAATATPLNTVVHNPLDLANNDTNAKWPTSYLVGAYNAGKIQPGDELEYTIYYLNAQGADATNIKICDPIRGKQTYTASSMQLLPGGTSIPIALTDLATDTTIDRANPYPSGVANVPANCTPSSSTVTGTDNGGVAIQLTGIGASTQPDLLSLPGATAAGTPSTSYGWFRFTTKVDK